MFALGDKPFRSNLAERRHLFGGYEIALIDLSSKVREGILRFLARVEGGSMPDRLDRENRRASGLGHSS